MPTPTPTTKKRETTKRINIANTATTPQATSKPVSDDERNRLVAEKAYFIAEKRGFQGGNELDDWLEAERQVEFQMKGKRR